MVDMDKIVVMVRIEAEYVLRWKNIYIQGMQRKDKSKRKHFSIKILKIQEPMCFGSVNFNRSIDRSTMI